MHGDHPDDGYTYEGCPGCHPMTDPTRDPFDHRQHGIDFVFEGCDECADEAGYPPSARLRDTPQPKEVTE